MAPRFVADCKLATMIPEVQVAEHAPFSEELPTRDGWHGEQRDWVARKVADWQKFCQDFCNLCQRLGHCTEKSDDRRLNSTAVILDFSALCPSTDIILTSGMPKELQNVPLLRNHDCPDFGTRAVVEDVPAIGDRRDGFDVRPESTGETARTDRPDALDCILREILAELKQIARREMLEVHELRTEPLSVDELGVFFHCHRNQVMKNILPKYNPEKVGKNYRMRVMDMPPAYFLKLYSAVPVSKDRNGPQQSRDRRDTHAS